MNKQKVQVRYLLFVLLAVTGVAVFLGIQNIALRKEFREVQAPSYIFDAGEQISLAQQSGSDVVIVKNGTLGLWDKKGKKGKIRLVRELTIGEKEGDSTKVFYRIGPVVVDDSGNIYVCEIYDSRIKKFSREGDYLLSIGRKGSGPGELLTPLHMAFDKRGNLCVLDWGNQRISKFSPDGRYLGTIRVTFSSTPVGFAIGASAFYISMYDLQSEKVIRKYSHDGVWLGSFGDPVKFREPVSYTDIMVKRNISAGPITLVNNELYFSQRNPYEIRKFTTDGKLKMRIFRKNSFMPPAKVEIIGKETYQFKVPAQSSFIAIWRNKIINWVSIPEYLSSKTGSVIDLFDLNGRLLTSLEVADRVWARCLDREGKIYGVLRDKEGVEKVVRYRLDF